MALVLLSQLLPGEMGICCHPALLSHQTSALKCHRSRRPGFEPPFQILLPDTQHRPLVCGYYRLNASDIQLRVTWAQVRLISGVLLWIRFLSTREHSNTTYKRGMGTGGDCNPQPCLTVLVSHAVELIFFIVSGKP